MQNVSGHGPTSLELRLRHLTGGDDVVYHEDRLALLDGIGLYLEEVLTVLLLIARGLGGTRQLALFPHGHKARAQTKSEAGSEEKASGLQADDDVWSLAFGVVAGDVEFEGADESFVQVGVAEEGEDVFEEDARRGEVWKLAQGSVESYLKTGEFGGGGGSGGGLSGDFGGGIWMVSGRVGGGRVGGHDERKSRKGEWVRER